MDAETKGRVAQRASASGNKPADKSGDKKPSYKGPGGNPDGSGEGQAQQRSAGTGARSASSSSSSSSKPVQKAAPAKDRMADASKADRMSAWAKANPKLAAAQKQRASTRGTSATTNPLMKDFKKRMPKPAAPAKSPSLTGNKASTSMSSGGAKAVSPTAKPQPVTKNTNVTGNKLSYFSSSGGFKATAPQWV